MKLGVDCRIGVNNGLEMMVNPGIGACRNGTSYTTVIYVVHIHFWLCPNNFYGVKPLKFFHHDIPTMSEVLIRHLYITKRQFKPRALLSSIASAYFTVNPTICIYELSDFDYIARCCGL